MYCSVSASMRWRIAIQRSSLRRAELMTEPQDRRARPSNWSFCPTSHLWPAPYQRRLDFAFVSLLLAGQRGSSPSGPTKRLHSDLDGSRCLAAGGAACGRGSLWVDLLWTKVRQDQSAEADAIRDPVQVPAMAPATPAERYSTGKARHAKLGMTWLSCR